MPARVQFIRAKGYSLEHVAPGYRSVGRRTMFENPFTVADAMADDATLTKPEARAKCARLFRHWLDDEIMLADPDTQARREWILSHLDELRGKPLACSCPLPGPGEPDHCHAVHLLELSNRTSPAGPSAWVNTRSRGLRRSGKATTFTAMRYRYPAPGAYAVPDPYRPLTVSYWVIRPVSRKLEAWPAAADGTYGPPRPPRQPGTDPDLRREALGIWRAATQEYRRAVLIEIIEDPEGAANRFAINTERCPACQEPYEFEALPRCAAATLGEAAAGGGAR
jgi:Domain of unknown function (DUF4326)